MNIRLRIEDMERETLSKYAMLSENTRGRKYYEKQCSMRTDYQRDRDRIIHSKSFRRLKHKTQVFVAPEGDHFRTRLTHTLEVSQIGRTLARALKLNEDLVEAIALGHDLGHTPFGHTGERVLNKLNHRGFNHNEQSLRVVDLLEHKSNRIGLNLTYEVREGIINHSGRKESKTLEGQIVRFSDRIAYINHDIDDAIRADVIKEDKLPKDCIKILGDTHGERINSMILDIIENSLGENKIAMGNEFEYYTNKLRDYMFENVYLNKNAKSEEFKVEYIIEELYKYYLEDKDNLPKAHLKFYDKIENVFFEDIISDYIAGMTDRYLLNTFNKIFVPKPWEIF